MKQSVTAVVLLSGLALLPCAHAQSASLAKAPSPIAEDTPVPTSADMPPLPPGKSTVFGGEIRTLDPVRDQLTLKVYGERPMKVLFDERTQVFRDGQKVSLRDLKAEEHASVQTTLDGTKLFAVSIHMLSNAQQGEYEGRVTNFNPGTGDLTVAEGDSRQTIKVLVQGNTSFTRKGQSGLSAGQPGQSDLVNGALVSLRFQAAGKEEPVATQVTVLAVPGSNFVFSGTISSFDLHSGLLILTDPRDEKSYQVSFNAANLPYAQSVHLGDSVRVVATYDGVHYAATELTKN